MDSAGEETKEQDEKVEKKVKEESTTSQENGNYPQTYPQGYYQYPQPIVDPYQPYPQPPPANGYYPPAPAPPPGPSALDSLLAFQPPDAGDFKVAASEVKPLPETEAPVPEVESTPSSQEKPPEKVSQPKGSKRKIPAEDDSSKKEEEKKEKDKKKKKSQDDVKILNIRKNIRDVIEENQLDANTLAAQRQESERLARVQEQQKVIREIQKQIHNNRAQQKLSGLLSGTVAPHGTAPSDSGSNASGSDSILRSNLSSSSSNNTYIVKGVAQEVKFSGCSFVELDQEESTTSVDSAKEQEVSFFF